MGKRFLLVLATIVCTGACHAGGYVSALKRFFLESGAVYEECRVVCAYYMEYYVAGLRDEGVAEDTVAARQARFDAYVDKWLVDDVTEVFLPYFEANMSEADFGDYLQVLGEPGVRDAEEHLNVVQLGLMDDFTDYLQHAVVMMMNGETVELLESPECTAEYEGKFNAYMKDAGHDDVFYNEELAQVFAGYGAAEAGEVVFHNLRTMALERYTSEVPESEFDAVLRLMSSEVYDAYRRAVQDGSDDDAFNRILERLSEAVGFDILPE